MDWIFRTEIWVPTLLALALFLMFLPVLLRRWVAHRLESADPPKEGRSFNVQPIPSRGNAAVASDRPRPAHNSAEAAAAARCGEGVGTAQGARGDGRAYPEYQESPTLFAIFAKVRLLQPPVREKVEQSYKGKDVRWKLRLAGISEGVERGPVRSVRMYPDSQAAETYGIYFVVNLDEHPQLQEACKDEAFVVEGTIESVSGTDIDLKNVRKVQKVA